MSSALRSLPAHQLLSRVHALVRRGNAVEAELLAHLGEVDARRLYLDEGYSSMFVYCLRVLHFPEGVAYKRIHAARAARRHPELLDAVRQGDLHATGVSLLAPQITPENSAELIRAAKYKSADEIRRLLADRQPRPDVVASMRRVHQVSASARVGADPTASAIESERPGSAASGELGAGGASGAASAVSEIGLGHSGSGAPSSLGSGDCVVATHEMPAAAEPGFRAGTETDSATRPTDSRAWADRARREPLGGERYCVRFMADQELHEQLLELQALMRHQVPDGDLGKILGRAVGVLLEKVRKQKFGECEAPRAAKPSGTPGARPPRQIPAAVRRAVSRRDGGRCTYVAANGRRCGSREFLEFHHRDPWARNREHTIAGITLRCRAHNQHEARRDFGERHMNRFRKRAASRAGMDPETARRCSRADHPQLDLDPVATELAVRETPGHMSRIEEPQTHCAGGNPPHSPDVGSIALPQQDLDPVPPDYGAKSPGF